MPLISNTDFLILENNFLEICPLKMVTPSYRRRYAYTGCYVIRNFANYVSIIPLIPRAAPVMRLDLVKVEQVVFVD